ncbi:hypothetical protein C8R44DRAFT_865822 [Mycena epipterygia]|nr:hypothetical protein C8R44DRAFT_865822 [Mycena epipterygia]
MPAFDINGTIGAFEIGILLSYMLFGVATTQAYIYHSRFPHDSRALKSLVMFVWACEVAHTVCIGHTFYVTAISQYGNLEHLTEGRIPLSLAPAAFFSGIVAAFVQSFFALRIYKFSNRLFIPCLCWVLSALRVLCSIVILIFGTRNVTIEAFVTRWNWLLNTIWAVSSANDFTIAVAMVYWLYRKRPEMPLRSGAMLDKLIKWTIETGVITGCSGLITLACFVSMKNNYIWIAWYVVMAKLFSNSLFASLNSRATLRAMDEAAGNITLPCIVSISVVSTPHTMLPPFDELKSVQPEADHDRTIHPKDLRFQ